MKRKLMSRKFWTAAAGIITGIALILGADESTLSSVSGAVTALASVLVYIITEGRIDAAALKEAEKNMPDKRERI